MNRQQQFKALRLGMVLSAMIGGQAAFADGAYAWGNIAANTLTMSFPGAISPLVTFDSTTTYDFGPSYHYSDSFGPYLAGNSSVQLYTATDAFATGNSNSGVQASSTESWLLTNNTSFFETAELTYDATLVSQSLAPHPLTEGSFNLEDLYVWDSVSNNTTQLAALNTNTISSVNDYLSGSYSANLFYVVNPFSSETITFQESSTSYALATPEPGCFAALGVGLGVLGLRRRKRSH